VSRLTSGRFFLDTNVLVYANDASAPAKRDRARQLLVEAFETRQGCLSTQVLQEFFVVVTKKGGVPGPNARAQVVRLLGLDTVVVDAALVTGAIDLHLIHGLSFWDALVIKAAAAGGCAALYSEDLQAGRVLDGVRVVNPFAGL
jgi:predicted nucleic acid-binding protein